MKKDEPENRLFFRYQKIDKYTKKNLEQNVLYFNDPENFNDPFDCKISTTHEGTKKDWYNFVLRNPQFNVEPTIINQWIRNRVLKLKRNRKKDIYMMNKSKIGNASWEDIFNKRPHSICCFSAKKLNILMWSHYAENHQGICLCFKTHKNGDEYFLTLDSEAQILYKVCYDGDMPQPINTLVEGGYLELVKFFLTKYEDWEYEDEYRILIPRNKSEQDCVKKYREEDLEGVIFGLNAKPEKIEEIYEIIDTHYLQQGINVNLYSAHKVPDKFAIEVKKIQSIDKYLKMRS